MASTDDPQREYKGRRDATRTPARRPFTRYSQRSQLCLTGLWPVVTLVSEALSAGFADVASTAIPAHFEAKGNSLTGDLQRVRRVSGGFSAGPAEFLPVKMQAAAASALGSPPSGSRSGASYAGLSGTALHAARQGPDFPPIGAPGRRLTATPHAGPVARPPRRQMGRRRIRSWLLWLTPNIPNKPRANL
jgi:hypothetical protein